MARDRILWAAGLVVMFAVLGLAFRAYLSPDFLLDLGNLLMFCA